MTEEGVSNTKRCEHLYLLEKLAEAAGSTRSPGLFAIDVVQRLVPSTSISTIRALKSETQSVDCMKLTSISRKQNCSITRTDP
jgi:hypothetical protein